MASLKVPFALDSHGEIVCPDKSLARIPLKCPSQHCGGAEVRFRRGRRPDGKDHFFHVVAPSGDLPSCGESALHYAAKHTLAELVELPLSALTLDDVPDTPIVTHIHSKSVFTVERAEVERGLMMGGARRPDVRLYGKDSANDSLVGMIAVEIHVSNALSGERDDWYREHGIACIEIRMKGLPEMPTQEDLRTALADVTRQRWVYHPRQAEAAREHRDRVNAFLECPPEMAEPPSEEERVPGPTEAFATWRARWLPQQKFGRRDAYWRRYEARLAAHQPQLKEAVAQFTSLRDEACHDWAMSASCDNMRESFAYDDLRESLDRLINLLATEHPDTLADAGAMQFVASCVNSACSTDDAPLTPADVLWLLKERVDPGVVVPAMIKLGQAWGDFAKGASVARFNEAQRQHEQWLAARGVPQRTVFRAVICPHCRERSQLRGDLAATLPKHYVCQCGRRVPITF